MRFWQRLPGKGLSSDDFVDDSSGAGASEARFLGFCRKLGGFEDMVLFVSASRIYLEL